MDLDGLAASLGTKRSAGITPEVNLKILLHASKGIHPKFETYGRSPEVQNRGISGPTKKGWCPPKIFLKNLMRVKVAST